MQKIPDIQRQNHNHNVLDTDRVGWLLVKLTTPAFFGMFVQTLYNVVNTIFIGRFVGPLAIAGLSIVFPLQMLAMGIGMMVGMGGSSLISRFIGAGNISGAERTIGNGITVGIIMSIVVTIVVLPFANFWLRLIGASDAVLPFARDYLIIIISGTVFNVFAMALLSFVRAEGNARVGMIAMMLGAVLNIILDAIFIVWLDMGVTGAALGTVIAQITSMIYLFSYYVSGSSYLKIHIRNLLLDFSILRQMFAIGIAAFAQTVAGSLSAMLLINMVVRYGGDIALGAFGIIQRVMMFAIMPAMVFGQGLQPILGFNYGAKRYHLALKATYIAAIVSTSLSMLGFLVLYFLPEPIIRIFTSDTQLVSMGTYASRLVFLSLPLMGAVMVGQIIFQAIGKAVQSFITAIVRPVVFLIPMVLIMSRLWQLDGVFLSFPTSDMLTLILVLVLLSPIINQFRKAAKAEKQGKEEPVLSNRLLDSTENSRIIE
jgi:putative MATE family efflux protein